MALVESIDIKINTRMPDFNLDDPDGKMFTSKALLQSKGLAVFFTCKFKFNEKQRAPLISTGGG